MERLSFQYVRLTIRLPATFAYLNTPEFNALLTGAFRIHPGLGLRNPRFGLRVWISEVRLEGRLELL